MHLKAKLKYYYFTAIFSVIFAAVGFGYNTWRMEVSEDNNNIRTAAFEILLVLAEFEQVIYAAHYDNDKQNGSARLGWVKVGLAHDLSMLVDPQVEQKVGELKSVWREKWPTIVQNRDHVNQLIEATDSAREEIKRVLKTLE